MVPCVCPASPWKVGAGVSGVQSHLWLHIKFWTTVGFLRTYLKKKKNQWRKYNSNHPLAILVE